MVNFTVEQLRAQMDDPDRIRNMSVIAHVDHGKSTLTDSLIAAAGIISLGRAGNARATDTREDEQERGVTIKSTGISLFYECDLRGKGNEGFLINLIDSPGHVDFSSEVTAALRVTDGALVVVDCIEGVSVQTETVLRQALSERVKPVLMLNKMDRTLIENNFEAEEAYRSFQQTIDNINALLSIYSDKSLPSLAEYQVHPCDGTVAFGSGYFGWGFTIHQFARMYARGNDEACARFQKLLWGNNFFDPKTNKWSKKEVNKEGHTCVRGFNMYIWTPIFQLTKAIMQDRIDDAFTMLSKLGVNLNKDEKEMRGKTLLKRAFQLWLPAAQALLEMIVLHLPSPREAQSYRYETLYEGPLDDECAVAIKNCDPKGPLMLYVSKMIPTGDGCRFIAFGRVFSGTVRSGQKVRIMGSGYTPTSHKDLHIKNIQRTVIMMGGSVDNVDDVPAGNTCGLLGVDQYILKTGTISDCDTACTIKAMKFSVSPVVRVAVSVKNPSDLPKLIEGLKRLSKSDPCVLCESTEHEHIVAGAGELHLEICLKDLRDDFCKCDIITSNPVVSYNETVVGKSDHDIMTKSANKHNRFIVTCEAFPSPVDPEGKPLTEAIKDGDVAPGQDPKVRAKFLETTYGFARDDVLKIWGFGPGGNGPNMVLDVTTGVQYLNEVRDHCMNGFQSATENGPLAEEACVGLIFKVHDAKLHSDSIHRGGAQITPCFKRACWASMLCAQPRFLEPMYLVDITAPEDCVGSVYTVLTSRRGEVEEDNPREGTPLHQIRAYLPVSESFGFDAVLRQETSGRAFPQCSFSHWKLIEQDPLVATTSAGQLLMSIRKRKGLKEEMPAASRYEDRL